MRITIEDLEALKELSDELEENHVETEKQLQEDLGLWLASSFSMLLPLLPEKMSRIPKFGITFAKLKLLKNHVKIWTTLSTNSENLLCSYRRTCSTSVISFVNYIYDYSY